MSLLRYAPPAQVSPTTLFPGLTGATFGSSAAPLSATTDYIIQLPVGNITGQIRFYGGRHVRMIGGTFLPGAGIGNYVIVGQQVAGSFFAEGLEFPDQSRGLGTSSDIAPDVIDVCGDWSGGPVQGFAPDIYLQNIRCLNITASNSTNHADFFQPQGLIGNLYVDKLTVSTNYDVFTIAADVPTYVPPLSANFSRVNTWWYAQNAVNPFTAHYWLNSTSGSAATDTRPFPISFYQAFCSTTRAVGTGGGRVEFADVAIYPNSSDTAGGGLLRGIKSLSPFTNGQAIGAQPSVLTHGQGFAYFSDPAMLVTGVLTDGNPDPSNADVITDSDGLGSYVPAGIGTSYVSPGYMAGGVLAPIAAAVVRA